MQFDILTIFPHMIESYANESILKRAQEGEHVRIRAHDLRTWASDAHRSVDDAPYGGGPGMVLRADIIHDAVRDVRAQNKNKTKNTRVVLFSPAGTTFTQKDAERYHAEHDHLILICGRYEGVDERVAQYIADEVVSIGDFVLSGGEIPALVVVDAVSRLVPGVLGEQASEESRRLGVGVPVYTRPEKVEIDGEERHVPDVLLSGNHAKITEWRKKHQRG